MEDILKRCPNATWFMIIDDSALLRRDTRVIYMNNERDEIIRRYQGRKVKRFAGFGNESIATAQSIKILLA